MTTIRELRDFIADNCDFTQPLCFFSYDVGRAAKKHSAVRVDQSFPTMMNAEPGLYDDRGVIELKYVPEGKPLMPEAALEALDGLLEEKPRSTVGFVYFLYYPMEYKGLFGRTRQVKESMLSSTDVKAVYPVEGNPNALIVEAAYEVNIFDM